MNSDLERALPGISGHPLIAKYEIRAPRPLNDRINRLRLTFTNGRGASIINGPGLYMDYGDFEIAALDKDGDLDYTTDVIGYNVRKGDGEQIMEWVLALAQLPPEPGKELVRQYWFIDGYTIVEVVPPEEFVFYVGSAYTPLPASTADLAGWQEIGYISADTILGGHRGVDVAGAYIDETLRTSETIIQEFSITPDPELLKLFFGDPTPEHPVPGVDYKWGPAWEPVMVPQPPAPQPIDLEQVKWTATP